MSRPWVKTVREKPQKPLRDAQASQTHQNSHYRHIKFGPLAPSTHPLGPDMVRASLGENSRETRQQKNTWTAEVRCVARGH